MRMDDIFVGEWHYHEDCCCLHLTNIQNKSDIVKAQKIIYDDIVNYVKYLYAQLFWYVGGTCPWANKSICIEIRT